MVTRLEQILKDNLSSPVTILGEDKDIDICINSNFVFSLKVQNSEFVEIIYEEDYDKSAHFEYVKAIVLILEKNGFKVSMNNKTGNFIYKIKKLFSKKDIFHVKKSINQKCKYSEIYFYNILRPNNKYYRMGVLIYFNSELVGILKIYNNKSYLGLHKDYGRMLLLDLPLVVRKRIWNGKKPEELFKSDDWPRVNLIGDKLPLSFELVNTECRRIGMFSELKKKKEFMEVFNQKDETILREFTRRVDECFKQNKDISNKFDDTILLSELEY